MIHQEIQDGIIIARMENGKVNALTTSFLNELTEYFEKIDRDKAPALVISGSGNCFCAGVNLLEVFSPDQENLSDFIDALNRCFKTLFMMKTPVVAAINGPALAGGCIIVACCDYKIASEEKTKIGITELKVGLPFPSIPLEIMKFILPKEKFQNVFYSAEIYSAVDALKLGLVDEVVPHYEVLAKAILKAKELAAIPQSTFKLTKTKLRNETTKLFISVDGLQYDEQVKNYWLSEECQRSVLQFMEKLKNK